MNAAGRTDDMGRLNETMDFVKATLDRIETAARDNSPIVLSRKEILDVLENCSSMCLDNAEERQKVVDALVARADTLADAGTTELEELAKG